MKDKNFGGYIFFLGVAITAIGILSPWWCSGHHSFACTNSIGFTWHTTFNFKYLKLGEFTPSIGIILPILLVALVWIEVKQPVRAFNVRKALASLIFVVCAIAIINTLQLVREANHCQSFTAWTTRYIDIVFPISITCTSYIFWITDVFQGTWITFAGVFILLFVSLIKPKP